MNDFKISIDDDNKIVIVAYEGDLTIQSAALATRDARKKAFELGYGTLHDITGASLNATIIDAYSFPRQTSVYEEPVHRTGKTVILADSSQNQEFLRFYETTARNAGLNARLFYLREDALSWLASE